MPLPLFLCVWAGLRPSTQPWTTARGFRKNWPRWKFLLELPTVSAAYGHILTLHLSHHPSFLPILNQAPYPSFFHPLTLEEGSKRDCNYNQTRTLCSVSWCPSPSATVPACRRLRRFQAALDWSSPTVKIERTQSHANFLILPSCNRPAVWRSYAGF